MPTLNQLTTPNDPKLRINLPAMLLQELKAVAKINRRRYQDEFIKRIALSFQHDEAFQAIQFNDLQQRSLSHEPSRFIQVIPADMLAALEHSARENGTSVEQMVASRLLATFIRPEAFGFNSLLEQILNHTFTQEQAMRECAQKRENWFHIYEIEKLHLFLEFKDKLPRSIKESFLVIDVKEETKRILAKLKDKKSSPGSAI